MWLSCVLHWCRPAGRRDGTITIWQISTISAFGQQLGPSAATPVNCIAFSHDSKLLAFGDAAGNVGVYNLQDDLQQPLPSPRGPGGLARGRSLARTTSSLAAIGSPFAMENSRPGGAAVQQSGEAAVTCCAFSPDGSQLATGHASGRVMLWDLPGGSPSISFNMELHSSPVQSCCFWPGRPYHRLISSAADCIAVATDMLAVRQGKDGVRFVVNVLGSSRDEAGQGPGQGFGQQHQPDLLHECPEEQGTPQLLQVQPCGRAMAYVTSRRQLLKQLELGQGQDMWAPQQRHINWSHQLPLQQQPAGAGPQQAPPLQAVKSRPLCSLQGGILARAQYVHPGHGNLEGSTTISLFQDSQPAAAQLGSAAAQLGSAAAAQPGDGQYRPNLGVIQLAGLEVTTLLLGVEVGLVAAGCIRLSGDCGQGESLVVLKAHQELMEVAGAELGPGEAYNRSESIWR